MLQREILSVTPSFAAQSISDLGKASLDAVHCGDETPCTSNQDRDFLALFLDLGFNHR
jgi:hypothetical protein